MHSSDWIQLALFFSVLLLSVPLLGGYMAKVYAGQKTWLSPVIAPLERLVYRLGGVQATEEMNWKTYAVALCLFNALGFGVRAAIIAVLVTLQPGGHGGGSAGSGDQYGR